MSELYNNVDYKNLKYEYVGFTKDASFYKYENSKEFFNAIKNNQIKFSEVKNKQNEFLNKVNNIKIGKDSIEPKETINNLEKFYNSRQEAFLKTILKCYLMLIAIQNIVKLREKDLRY